MPSRKISIWMGESIQELMATRKSSNRSGAVNAAVSRYLEICHRHMPTFSVGEWCAIFDALNGVWMSEAWSPAYIFAEVADTRDLGAKWEIDQDALVEKLRALSYAELVAVTEATERFWSTDTGIVGDANHMTLEEVWRDPVVGIVGEDAVA